MISAGAGSAGACAFAVGGGSSVSTRLAHLPSGSSEDSREESPELRLALGLALEGALGLARGAAAGAALASALSGNR